MTSSSDELDRVGFLRSDVWPLLAKAGIEVPVILAIPKPTPSDCPEWKQVMALLPTLSVAEAASAFAGVDLEASGYRSEEEYAEVSRWKSVIDRAIGANALPAQPVGFDKEGEPSEWRITPADLTAWCVANRREYPLPTPLSLPTTDAGLRKALLQSDQERAQWKAKAEELAAAGDQCTSLKAEIELLRGELSKRSDELAALTRERDQLKADTLAGKSRTTALKIIGGLAMQGYSLNIHAARLDGIGRLVEDLQRAGADVTEKTLRGFLKDAAHVIEPEKKKP